MHLPVPWLKGFENVPRGHGNNLAIVSLRPNILNPEAKRAETCSLPLSVQGSGMRRASVWVSSGFLRDNNALV